MPTIYQLKPAFQAWLRPLVTRLAAAKVTANQVTVTAVILSAMQGAAIALWPQSSWPLLALPLVLFLRMALNAIDGMLAREFHMKSRLGAVLNELGDVVADVLLYLPLALVPGISPIAVVMVVILAIMVEMAGVVAIQIGADRRYDGPFGKSDRAFGLGALGLAIGLGMPAGTWVTVLLWIMASLSVVTIIKRSRQALAVIPK
jgi:CDP-diacylglycerol---glycerol-3-phosphate 3-phosphatidyltransferase